jgi:talin
MDGVGETATDMDKAYQDTLIGLAKAVANATAQLVLKAKTVASTTEDQEMQNRVISSATSCALATSQLVACTKVNLSQQGLLILSCEEAIQLAY